jgi:transposase
VARAVVQRTHSLTEYKAESQARFACTACGYASNADVNGARDIAAGHAVKARGGDRRAGPVNREPQPLASLRA